MNVEEHYNNHLANFYSWMVGDFDQKRTEFQDFLENNRIYPKDTKVAIDLGAGHGIQSVALKNMGFDVTAIDFNEQLLDELKSHPEGKSIKTVKTNIRNIKEYSGLKPALIVCWGDTITHLENKAEIEKLIGDCTGILCENGKLILSYRDYSNELNDQQRFIPVKSDKNRILTCILDYEPDKVKVTDLLHEKTENGWNQKVSSYRKVRITPKEIAEMIENNGMKMILNESINRMQTTIAEKD
jgi:2-polyprenyl-3-methyl-5-hydroxy-6-metoxy-1,4-benzoquinol methylase